MSASQNSVDKTFIHKSKQSFCHLFPQRTRKRRKATINSTVEPGRGGGYSHILAIRVCAAGKAMVFKPFSLV